MKTHTHACTYLWRIFLLEFSTADGLRVFMAYMLSSAPNCTLGMDKTVCTDTPGVLGPNTNVCISITRSSFFCVGTKVRQLSHESNHARQQRSTCVTMVEFLPISWLQVIESNTVMPRLGFTTLPGKLTHLAMQCCAISHMDDDVTTLRNAGFVLSSVHAMPSMH